MRFINMNFKVKNANLLMRKILLIFFLAVFSVTAFAELDGNGYYRVQNAYTKRYAYLVDDKGKIDTVSTSVDVGALELYLNFLRASSDPSTIFYISKAENAGSGSYYDIGAQGTSLHGFLNEYLKIIKAKSYDGEQSYYAYASKSGMSKYLGDRRVDMNEEKGISTSEATKDSRLWYIRRPDASSDEYFGIAPTLTANGKYYYPLFAGFPFSAYSEGIKFYYVDRVDSYNGVAVIKEAEGTIPAGKAVIVECSNPLATDNRLNVGAGGSMASLEGSMLKGVYFDNPVFLHYNRTPYDKQSMRTLSVVNGKLTFVVGEDEFLPRNQAYLQLSDENQYATANYTLMTESDYENEYAAVGIIPESDSVDVFSLDGRLLKSAISKSDVSSLGKGLYILKGKSKSEKFIVR